MEDLIGNLTTIIKFIVMTIVPALGIDAAYQEPLTGAVVGVVGFILAFLDARYNNTFISQGEQEDGSECSESC